MINYTNSPASPNIPFEKGWNYEEAVAKVEKIIAEIESGKLELAQIFDEFAAAVEYLRECETFLQEKQQQVDLLIENIVDEADSF
ncbi:MULTISPECIES: exodeoxyribonuclease VII small subunit [Aerosakkonema]|uniref:exodeoxyribonuclease VII small subunit n=1 Tax=Aerosakkonema TaxID=1246629 RepID=UPI0035B7F2D9